MAQTATSRILDLDLALEVEELPIAGTLGVARSTQARPTEM
jgi:hypothetical protein